MKQTAILLYILMLFSCRDTSNDDYFRKEIETDSGKELTTDLDVNESQHFFWVKTKDRTNICYLFWKKNMNTAEMITAFGFPIEISELMDTKLNRIMEVQYTKNKWFGLIEMVSDSTLKVEEEESDGSIGKSDIIVW